MKFEEMLFLKESYNETLENYNLVLKRTKKFGWDWIIITSSNQTQAKSYQYQINYRKEQGLLPDVRIDVIPDENDKRIGSGGATLNVLKFLSENDPNWNEKKILLIHSGGDSKRIPQYSACGKLFSHVPRSLIDNRPSTIFDEFMVTLSLVPDKLKSGILIVSGDVLLLFNYLQLDVYSENAIAISIKEDCEIGKNHGVFLTDEKGILSEFLHKNTVESLRKKQAIDENNMIDIDTGLIWIDNIIASDLLSLIQTDGVIDSIKKNKYINDINRLSFYGDLLYPLSSKGTLENYLESSSEGVDDDNLKECRKKIWEVLNKYNMRVIKTSPSKFIHIGTTNELINFNISADEKYSFLNWTNNVLTNIKCSKSSIINSFIGENVKISASSFIEDSILENATIGKNSIITGGYFRGEIPDNTVLQILPIKIDNNNYFVARTYSIFDNPKETSKYMNNRIEEFLENNKLTEKELWDNEEKSLWTANLFEICNTEDEAIEAYNRLIRLCFNKATDIDIEKFRESKRLSLSTSFILANMELITLRQEEIDIKIRTNLIINSFINGEYIEESCKLLNIKNVKKIVELILEKRDENNYKLDILLNYITNKYSEVFPMKSDFFENECYRKIKNILKVENKKYQVNEPLNEVLVKKPVRINFGGGWSDTPPYCIENGGTVLNVAISLNGKLPIEVYVKRYKKNHFKFISEDLDSYVEYNNISYIRKINEVGDPFILSKAALCCLGIVDSEKLSEYGIEITTKADVPNGSGLGTSSILAGTIVIALAKFYQIELSDKDVFDLILNIEQMVSTGGGWQDQIGGILPGLKLIETTSGVNQNYKITTLNQNDNILELDKRMLLIYTGQRRIAKNLLRKFMNKYMQNNPDTKRILKEIQHLALIMKYELEKGDVDSFASLLTKHFNLVKEIDSGITNVCIDHIIKSCEEFISGYSIAGAGGGGFLFVVLKKEVTKEQLEDKLKKIYKDNGIKIYDCSFV